MFVAVNNLANGAAQQNVSPIRIGELDLVISDKETMNSFEGITGKIKSQIMHLFSQIRLLTEARDRLLPKLMSGEIAV